MLIASLVLDDYVLVLVYPFLSFHYLDLLLYLKTFFPLSMAMVMVVVIVMDDDYESWDINESMISINDDSDVMIVMRW